MLMEKKIIESLLALDIGTVNTRASLFALTGGQYRFLARSQARSTSGGGVHIGAGVQIALSHLQRIVSRPLLTGEGGLILPTNANAEGVDSLALSFSAGVPLRVMTMGYVNSVAAKKLVESTHAVLVHNFDVQDLLNEEALINQFVRAEADVVVFSGGLDGGARRPIIQMLETLRLACSLLPEDKQPQVIYAGNAGLADIVRARMQGIVPLQVAANLQPVAGKEYLDNAQSALNRCIINHYGRNIAGMRDLTRLASTAMPGAAAIGRMVRFFNRAYSSQKGVLAIDLGASAVTLSAAKADQAATCVHYLPGSSAMLYDVQSIAKWLPVQMDENVIQAYFNNKIFHPAYLPATLEELLLEQAFARQSLTHALAKLKQNAPWLGYADDGLQAAFEPIIAAGTVLTHAPTPGQALLMLLDALQPHGVTTIVLDHYHLLAALGVAAGVVPLLPVQVMDSGAFLNLATVISPISQAEQGDVILQVSIEYETGKA